MNYFRLHCAIFASIMMMLTCMQPASGGVALGDYQHADFAPVRGEVFELPVTLEQPSRVSIAIYSPDHSIVRTIESDGELSTGTHSLQWDGKDEDGDVVPNEAYVPVVTARTTTNDAQIYDPRESGGVVEWVDHRISEQGDIIYSLETPSRVLIRVGVKAGPMLRALVHWEPRPVGRNVLRWDGFDSDQLVDLRRHPKLSVLVTAFTLPDSAIITYGHEEDYRTYSQRKGIEPRLVAQEDRALARGEQRVSMHHYLSRQVDVDPRVTVAFIEDEPTTLMRMASDETFEVKVDLHADDQWAMAQNLFEVAFFINDEFVAEEEHGYVPINWRYRPSTLEPGRHRLTVNISGFVGQVGVASIEFQIKEK